MLFYWYTKKILTFAVCNLFFFTVSFDEDKFIKFIYILGAKTNSDHNIKEEIFNDATLLTYLLFIFNQNKYIHNSNNHNFIIIIVIILRLPTAKTGSRKIFKPYKNVFSRKIRWFINDKIWNLSKNLFTYLLIHEKKRMENITIIEIAASHKV